MRRYQERLFLGIVCVVCIIGIVVVATLQILSISDTGPMAKTSYGGYLFPIFILGALWSVYRFRRNGASQKTAPRTAMKIAFASFGIAGVFYFLVYVGSLVCCGVEGVRFINANILAAFAIGVILSLPVVLKKLR